VLKRIRGLVIPPAWRDVWISPFANGHLQAAGRNERGRKQYRYHDDWTEARDADKYHKLVAFAKALPRIRRHVSRDLRRRGLPREKVLAAIVRLLETSLIRVGNDEYARTNGSFGLTTMKDRHVSIRGKTIRFQFRGKSGVERDLELQSPVLAKIARQCQELPGQELFQYLDEDEQVVDVTLLKRRTDRELRSGLTKLSPEEAAVLGLLQGRLKKHHKRPRRHK
jgi:DNA topoisomerase-1